MIASKDCESSESSSTEPLPELGTVVLTPSGSRARVIAINPHTREVLVQWDNGERAAFRPSKLEPLP